MRELEGNPEVSVTVHVRGDVMWQKGAPLPSDYQLGKALIYDLASDAMAAIMMMAAGSREKVMEREIAGLKRQIIELRGAGREINSKAPVPLSDAQVEEKMREYQEKKKKDKDTDRSEDVE